MLTMKEIKEAQAKGFEPFDLPKLIESYGIINIYKKEFMSIEKDIKTTLDAKSSEISAGKPIRQSITFPSGVYQVSGELVEDIKYSVKDVKKLRDEAVKASPSLARYFKESVTITQSNLSKLLMEAGTTKGMRDLIEKTSQTQLDINVKGE